MTAHRMFYLLEFVKLFLPGVILLVSLFLANWELGLKSQLDSILARILHGYFKNNFLSGNKMNSNSL